jgi:hypothetical protein
MSNQISRGTSVSSGTSNQSEQNSPKVTPFDQVTSNESFYDLTMSTLGYLIDKSTEKHDLSKDKDAIVMAVEEITIEDCRRFTSKAFASSLTNDTSGETKIYKHYAFVPGYSDLLPDVLIEEVQVYNMLLGLSDKINKFESDEQAFDDKAVDREKIQIIKSFFDTQEERRVVTRALKEKLNFLTVFYSATQRCSSGRFCKIKFPDKSNRAFGKMVKSGKRSLFSEIQQSKTMEEKLKIVQRSIKARIDYLNSIVAKDQLKRKADNLIPPEGDSD